ncbi:hypothetical protein [Sulfuricurvum sp.]|uniref:hypothetical protein n=1 Tax=Sulfuricurvum sp. TaxID=2025608 RepID=UPI002E34BC0B|nr:hypothetical protein [Sulfuricurvum sp.]HEX5328919.1 hypothetical protein [Sulfuricurvum sp.]
MWQDYQERLRLYEKLFGVAERNARKRLDKPISKLKPYEKFFRLLSIEGLENIINILENEGHIDSLKLFEYTFTRIPIENLEIFERHGDYTLYFDPKTSTAERSKQRYRKKIDSQIDQMLEIGRNNVIAANEFDQWLRNMENEYGSIDEFKTIAEQCFLQNDKHSLLEIEREFKYRKDLTTNKFAVINNMDAFDLSRVHIEEMCTEFLKNIMSKTKSQLFDPLNIETFSPSLSLEEKELFMDLLKQQIDKNHFDQNELVDFLLNNFYLVTNKIYSSMMNLDSSVIAFIARKKLSELMDIFIINFDKNPLDF